MSRFCRQFNLDPLVDATIVSPGCCFIKTSMGHLTLVNVDESIEKILHTINVDSNDIYVETKHYGRKEHFIDVISVERKD